MWIRPQAGLGSPPRTQGPAHRRPLRTARCPQRSLQVGVWRVLPQRKIIKGREGRTENREEEKGKKAGRRGCQPWGPDRGASTLGSSDPPLGKTPREAHCTPTFVNDLSETSALLFCSVRPATGCGPRSDPRAAGPAVTIHNRGWNKRAGPAPGSAGEAPEAQGGRELRLGRAGVQREGRSEGPSRGGLA